jgi:DNA-binding beta-propeller fold protein YncE
VTEFDLKTLKPIRTISVGQNPDAILYEPTTDRVFTFNGRSSDATAIDAATGNVAGTIPLGGRPEFPQADGKGKLFLNIEDKSQIAEIDPAGMKVANTWAIAPGEEPSGLAIDTHDHLLFSVCSNNKMTILNYDTGQVVASPTIGNGPDAAGFDPKYHVAFSSNGQSGTLDVIGKDSSGQWNVIQSVPTRVSARTMALDTRTHKIYLVSAEFEAIAAAPSTTPNDRPRRRMKPGTFTLLIVEPHAS